MDYAEEWSLDYFEIDKPSGTTFVRPQADYPPDELRYADAIYLALHHGRAYLLRTRPETFLKLALRETCRRNDLLPEVDKRTSADKPGKSCRPPWIPSQCGRSLHGGAAW